MDQQLFNMPAQKIVNVASVPQRSPFRYPGGKTWLVPRIRLWLTSLQERPAELVEPFCGGGITALTVAFEELARRVRMVEMDEDLAAVWRVVTEVEGGAGELAERIVSFDLMLANVRAVLDVEPANDADRAFRTILKNRVNRGGILSPGTGLIKAGENGKGLHSRWYPETLKKRILAIAEIRDRITFVQGDAFEAIRERAADPSLAWFIDPPYTVAGKRLYNHWELDHWSLFEAASNLAGDFLMTYDNDERVHELAKEFGFDTREVAMKNTHHAEMTELLIGRDLAWADRSGSPPVIASRPLP
jgi:DNA adenine methylase